jgi:hypothetical protein
MQRRDKRNTHTYIYIYVYIYEEMEEKTWKIILRVSERKTKYAIMSESGS